MATRNDTQERKAARAGSITKETEERAAASGIDLDHQSDLNLTLHYLKELRSIKHGKGAGKGLIYKHLRQVGLIKNLGARGGGRVLTEKGESLLIEVEEKA